MAEPKTGTRPLSELGTTAGDSQSADLEIDVPLSGESGKKKRASNAPDQEPAGEKTPSAGDKVSGLSQTVVDVLHGRAFKSYADGLRQYAAIRSGSLSPVPQMMRELKAVAASRGAEELTQAPGLRAQLFGILRDLSASRSRPETDALPYVEIKDETRQAIVLTLRTSFGRDDAELLELRYARELEVPEIAHVLRRARRKSDAVDPQDEPTIKARIEKLAEEAKFHVGADDWPVADALGAAFSLVLGDEPVEVEIEPLPIGTVLGKRYKIESRVGSGAFSDVYRAGDVEVPGHTVALKLLHQPATTEEARDASLRELRLIAAVSHPSIVQFKDNGWYENRLWFVMPWYEGETLEKRMLREPLTRPEAKRIFTHLARALGAMHEAGLRHQDIKPDNIFLARLRRFGLEQEGGVMPVLLDLGVAAKEAELVVAGTPNYFAPEVAAQFASIRPDHPVSLKSDVFSLVLSLRNALEPDTAEDVDDAGIERFIEHRALNLPAPFVSKDLAFLRGTFKRWMSLDPSERPTADELADEVAELTEPEESRARRIKVMRWLVPLLVVLGLGFGFTVYALNQAAELTELQKEQAELLAERTQTELDAESDRRRELEGDVEQISERYRSSDLSRQELAGELGAAEAELGQTRGSLESSQAVLRNAQTRLSRTTEERDAARESLTQTEQSLTVTEAALRRTGVELETANTRTRALERQVTASETALSASRAEVTSLTAQQTRLTSEVERKNTEIAGLRRQVSTLEAQAAEVRRERDQIQQQLTRAERRIVVLEAQVARLEAEARVRPIPATPIPATPIPATPIPR